jgi:hypothetical protein
VMAPADQTYWYETVINERNLRLSRLRGRLRSMRTNLPNLKLLASSLEDGTEIDRRLAVEIVNDTIRAIEREVE